MWQAKSLEKFEATALVVDGVLYTVQAPNDVVALDAVTGRPFWTFTYENLPDARNCCGRVNRGVADARRHAVYMGTLDAHLHRARRQDRPLLWKTQVGRRQATATPSRSRRRS